MSKSQKQQPTAKPANPGAIPISVLPVPPDDTYGAIAWIQGNAAVLASDYAATRRQLTDRLQTRRDFPDDADAKHAVSEYSMLHREYCSKIRPLYLAVLKHMPDFADLHFQRHCSGEAAAQQDLDAATAQWERLNLEASKRLEQLRPVTTPQTKTLPPMTRAELRQYIVEQADKLLHKRINGPDGDTIGRWAKAAGIPIPGAGGAFPGNDIVGMFRHAAGNPEGRSVYPHILNAILTSLSRI